MTVAFWCILAAALLPYVAFAKVSGLEQRTPRIAATALEGLSARANGAHLNAFEAFAPFAAAVIVSHIVEGASGTVDALAIAFIVVRLAHMAFYLLDRPPLRSACFGIGFLLVIAIFVQTAFH
ncbi:MAG: hypothetical protein E7774_04190 [Bradyrhizobium sp.]|nr:MAG: hypothetical protein E7774_04190 [Bradyrhizobium sp.]